MNYNQFRKVCLDQVLAYYHCAKDYGEWNEDTVGGGRVQRNFGRSCRKLVQEFVKKTPNRAKWVCDFDFHNDHDFPSDLSYSFYWENDNLFVDVYRV